VPSRVPGLAPVTAPKKPAAIRKAPYSKLFGGIVGRLRKKSRTEPRFNLFWQTVAVSASMLLFASVRPSPSLRATTAAAGSPRAVSLDAPSEQNKISKVTKVALRRSDYPIAKDFTSRVDARPRNIAAVEKSDLTRSERESVIKRVVINN
jgi:hypothetical protein